MPERHDIMAVQSGFRISRASAPMSRSPELDTWSSTSRNEWLRTVRNRLAVLADLPAGWDGYGAPRITPETTLFALQILQDLWTRRLPPPDISPMSNGALMIEWAQNGTELTIEIRGPYATTFLFERTHDGEEEEGQVGSDISQLQSRVAELVSPSGLVAVVG